MRGRVLLSSLAVLAACSATVVRADTVDPVSPQAMAQIVPGHSTKAELRLLLGAPWRVVQFDDCGQPMAGQAEETWEYRGNGPDGAYRLHVEFDDRGIVDLIAEIPDNSLGKGIIAFAVPTGAAMCLSM